jgi:hypothetical protein
MPASYEERQKAYEQEMQNNYKSEHQEGQFLNGEDLTLNPKQGYYYNTANQNSVNPVTDQADRQQPSGLSKVTYHITSTHDENQRADNSYHYSTH